MAEPTETELLKENSNRISRHATFDRAQRLRRPLYWKPQKKNAVEAIPRTKNSPTLKDGRKTEEPADG